MESRRAKMEIDLILPRFAAAAAGKMRDWEKQRILAGPSSTNLDRRRPERALTCPRAKIGRPAQAYLSRNTFAAAASFFNFK